MRNRDLALLQYNPAKWEWRIIWSRARRGKTINGPWASIANTTYDARNAFTDIDQIQSRLAIARKYKEYRKPLFDFLSNRVAADPRRLP